MKLLKISTYFLAALLALIGLSACEDEYFLNKAKPTLPPGTPVEISIGITIPQSLESVSGSRAAAGATMNTQVYDFYLMIFNDIKDDPEYGKLKSKYYFSSIDSEDERPCDPKYSSSGSAIVKRDALGSGTIRHVHTTSGQSRIIAVANCNRKGTALIREDLNRITTIDELNAYMVKTASSAGASDLNSTLMVMSGYYCETKTEPAPMDHSSPCEAGTDQHNGSVLIDAADLPGRIWLVPLHSRIKFVIDGNGHDAVLNPDNTVKIPAGEFIMTDWQVYNIPGHTHLLCTRTESDNIKPLNTDATISFTSNYEFTGNELKAGAKAPKKDNCYGFAFFCADNHPPADSIRNITGYEQRAAWDLNGEHFNTQTNPEDKHYTNAPATATYVVIRGRYVGASEITTADDVTSVKNVTADVTYTIFLGHDSDTNFNDFNVNRNYNYTYIVRVKGVNQISVEVNKTNTVDPRPDAEGHITVNETSDITLDAHYCQRVISYTRHNIKTAIDGGQFRVIATVPPRGVNINYIYTPGDGNELEGLEWIEAYRHPSTDINYVSYTTARGNAPQKKTLTIRQLLDDLYEFGMADGDPNEVRKYTIFFSEYYYGDDSWKEVVDSKERTLSLMGTVTYSPDMNSSYAVSGITFRQLPIRTIYNKSKVTKAWGIESIEEPLYANGSTRVRNAAGHVTKNVDSALGLENFWRHIYHGVSNAGQMEFLKYIDENGFLRTEASKYGAIPCELLAPCLLRNRDLDGDGKLGATECRWFVPTIEQYQQLFIGRSALPDSVQLYNPELEIPKFTDGKYAYKNYISSSNMNFWAEEGLSTGQITSGATHLGDYYIRCARALGIDEGMTKHGNDVPWNMHNYEDTTIDPMYTHTPAGENSDRHVGGVINLTVFRPDALKMVPELIDIPGVCNTFNDANKPSAIFEYADTIINLHGNSETNFRKDNMRAASSPQKQTLCNQILGPGWRMPNVSELVAVYWALGREVLRLPNGNNAANMLTRTHYYYWELLPADNEAGFTEKAIYKNPKNEGRRAHLLELNPNKTTDVFMLTTPNGTATDKENKVIRCVRDYTGE